MKCLLVFALVAVVAATEEKKVTAEIKPLTYATLPYAAINSLPYAAYNTLPYSAFNTLPYAYNTRAYASPLVRAVQPATPLTYTVQPVQTKFVPKEYEVAVKSFEFEQIETGCKNSFGNAVPCSKAKRSAEEEAKVTAEIKPLAYATLPYAAINTLPYAAYNTRPYAAYNTLPYAAYNTLPLTYAARPVQVKTLEPKIHEIEVPTPVLKRVVQKIPVGPACQNAWGFAVACA